MGPEEIRRLLTALLESSGAAWEQADGWICFRLSKDGAVWDMACRCLTGRMLAYGRLPLRAADRDEACRRCSQVNGQVIRGAMFLSEEGWPVFRTEAELPDPYDGARLVREAIEYNAAVLCRFWRLFAPEPPTL